MRCLAQLQHPARREQEQASASVDLEAEVVVQAHLGLELALGGMSHEAQLGEHAEGVVACLEDVRGRRG